MVRVLSSQVISVIIYATIFCMFLIFVVEFQVLLLFMIIASTMVFPGQGKKPTPDDCKQWQAKNAFYHPSRTLDPEEEDWYILLLPKYKRVF